MESYSIGLIPGDGIGKEVLREGVRVLDRASQRFGFTLDYTHVAAGAEQWKATGSALTDEQYAQCEAADALYMGAIGLPDALHPDGTEVSGDVMFRLRFGLDLYAGVRPVRSFKGVPGPLRDVETIDYVIVRENTEGIFASRDGGVNVRDELCTDTVVITRTAVARVTERAIELARSRQKVHYRGEPKVTCVDKANVLSTFAFFRKNFDVVADRHPDVTSNHVYVDAMALYQVTRPTDIDVIVTENFLGDILSDLSAASVGGMGLAPTGDIGDQHAMFQPAHGSAPDIAGQDLANPMATVLSGAMLLRWLGTRHSDGRLVQAAAAIDTAVERAIASGAGRTRDIGGTASTTSAGDAVLDELEAAS